MYIAAERDKSSKENKERRNELKEGFVVLVLSNKLPGYTENIKILNREDFKSYEFLLVR